MLMRDNHREGLGRFSEPDASISRALPGGGSKCRRLENYDYSTYHRLNTHSLKWREAHSIVDVPSTA